MMFQRNRKTTNYSNLWENPTKTIYPKGSILPTEPPYTVNKKQNKENIYLVEEGGGCADFQTTDLLLLLLLGVFFDVGTGHFNGTFFIDHCGHFSHAGPLLAYPTLESKLGSQDLTPRIGVVGSTVKACDQSLLVAWSVVLTGTCSSQLVKICVNRQND